MSDSPTPSDEYLPPWSWLNLRSENEPSRSSASATSNTSQIISDSSSPRSSLMDNEDIHRPTSPITPLFSGTSSSSNLKKLVHSAADTRAFDTYFYCKIIIDESDRSFEHEYTNGSQLKGHVILHNRFGRDVHIEDILVTFEGESIVETPIKSEKGKLCVAKASHVFLRMIDHYASFNVNLKDPQCGIRVDDDGYIIGLPQDGVMTPGMKVRSNFTFNIPHTLLNNSPDYLRTHYCQLPPSFGLYRDPGERSVTETRKDFFSNVEISDALGYERMGATMGSPLAVQDYCPKYAYTGYFFNVRIIGPNFMKKESPLAVVKEHRHHVRFMPTGYYYDLAEENEQEDNLRELKQRYSTSSSATDQRGGSEQPSTSANVKYEYTPCHESASESKLDHKPPGTDPFIPKVCRSFQLFSRNGGLHIGNLDLCANIPKQGMAYIAPVLIWKKQYKTDDTTVPPPDYNSVFSKFSDFDISQLKELQIKLDFESLSATVNGISSPPTISKITSYLNAFTFFNVNKSPILFNCNMVRNNELSPDEVNNIPNLKNIQWRVQKIPLSELYCSESKLKLDLVSMFKNNLKLSKEKNKHISLSSWQKPKDDSCIWTNNITINLDVTNDFVKRNISLPPSFQNPLISRIYELVIEMQFENGIKSIKEGSRQKVILNIPIRVRNVEKLMHTTNETS